MMIELALRLGWDERHRRRHHHVRDRGELVGRRLGLIDESGDDVGRRREEQHPAPDGADRMQAELQPGHDAEVASPTTDRPEEVRLRVGVGAHESPVGGHDVGGEQAVDRQAVLADEEPDASSHRDPADADGAGVPEPGRETVSAGRHGVLRGRESRSDPRGRTRNVDLESAHVRQVELDPAVGAAVPGPAMAATAHRELEPGLPGEPDGPRDVLIAGCSHDDRRAQIVPAVEDLTRFVVPGLPRADDATVQRSLEVRDRRRLQVVRHGFAPSCCSSM